MPRASDLEPGPPTETAPDPRKGRTPGGHFAKGNRLAVGARWKATLKKALGSTAASGELGIVASDAARVCAHVLRALPSDAAPVRVMVAIHARHVALNGYFTAKAEHAGLDTAEGQALLAIADRQSQRAERVLVTAVDLARVHAAQQSRAVNSIEQFRRDLEDGYDGRYDTPPAAPGAIVVAGAPVPDAPPPPPSIVEPAPGADTTGAAADVAAAALLGGGGAA